MKLNLFSIRFILLIVFLFLLARCSKTNPDNTTGSSGNEKPVPTPVGTVLGDSKTQTIGTSGGSLISSDGKAELVFPSGALVENTAISIQPITNNAPNGIENAYRFSPEGIQFNQPVTLKLHYTAEDLAATLSNLMGITFQDSLGFWKVIQHISNDTTNKIISVSINHFSDWTVFDFIELSPLFASVKVKGTVPLTLNYVVSDDDLTLLQPKNTKITWTVNGTENGNTTVGTLTGTDTYNQTYKAPAKAPSVNPVNVSAKVPFGVTFEGTRYDNLTVTALINIIDEQKFLLEIKILEKAAPLTDFVYSDSASMIVVIHEDQSVTISDIKNFAPTVNMITTTFEGCTATWIQDATGEVNIISANGFISSNGTDSIEYLVMTFSHGGATSPKFIRSCPGSDPETQGGEYIVGIPAIGNYEIIPGKSSYIQDNGDEIDKLTLLQ